jgi:hypothetical protein
LRGPGKAVGLTSSRSDELLAVGWVGMERAAGTVGTGETPVPTLSVRAARAVTTVDGLLGDTEGRAYGVPREAE